MLGLIIYGLRELLMAHFYLFLGILLFSTFGGSIFKRTKVCCLFIHSLKKGMRILKIQYHLRTLFLPRGEQTKVSRLIDLFVKTATWKL